MLPVVGRYGYGVFAELRSARPRRYVGTADGAPAAVADPRFDRDALSGIDRPGRLDVERKPLVDIRQRAVRHVCLVADGPCRLQRIALARAVEARYDGCSAVAAVDDTSSATERIPNRYRSRVVERDDYAVALAAQIAADSRAGILRAIRLGRDIPRRNTVALGHGIDRSTPRQIDRVAHDDPIRRREGLDKGSPTDAATLFEHACRQHAALDREAYRTAAVHIYRATCRMTLVCRIEQRTLYLVRQRSALDECRVGNRDTHCASPVPYRTMMPHRIGDEDRIHDMLDAAAAPAHNELDMRIVYGHTVLVGGRKVEIYGLAAGITLLIGRGGE